MAEARYAMADHAWAQGDLVGFLQWTQPIVDKIVASTPAPGAVMERELTLVMRTAHAMSCGESEPAAVTRVLEWAAQTGDRHAQYVLGLWLARMDAEGRRLHAVPGVAHYKRAIRWLQLAAEQGLADAWYALSKIYRKPECAQRNPDDARRCLERAGMDGHGLAQFELGMAAWRARHEGGSNDVHAVAWLLKAQAQGVTAATTMLEQIAARPTPAPWAQNVLQRLTRQVSERNALLVARLELAAYFGLSQSEALLIDVKVADHGCCLVVDVRAEHPYGKRRLILVQTTDARAMLDRVVAKFAHAKSGEEGNFRQRLYRLKTLA